MIKKTIHLNFHIKFSEHLDNTSYLYGSFYEKDNDSELFTQYKEENYIFKLDSEYNVEGQNYVSNRIWVDLVYYKDQHFIFKYQDDEHQYFQTLNHKKISIPLTDNKSYIFLLDHLFIFDPKDKNNNNILIYNNNLDKIVDFNISYNNLLDCYREKDKIEFYEKLSLCLSDYTIIHYKKMADKYLVIAFKENYQYYILRLNTNFDIQSCKKIIDEEKYIFCNFYKYKEFYYFIFTKNETNYLIMKCNSNFDILDEEKIKSYRCDIITLNDNLCLIIDDPKRYDKFQKQFKNQELMGNSSLLILN